MKILGLETSCDETAAAIVEDGERLLSNVVNSQIDIHKAYGGVVPEVAARSHVEVMIPVVEEALARAEMAWDDIDAIAVTYAPGLIGSLLIGTLTARTLALLKNKPLYPIHHVEAHVYANFIIADHTGQLTVPDHAPQNPSQPSLPDQNCQISSQNLFWGRRRSGCYVDEPRANSGRKLAVLGRERRVGMGSKFPMLALIVSGGHSQLVLFRDHGDYELLGQTQDDAIGEAFDKVAKILGLPYPGGPSIASAATRGDPYAYDFPKAKLHGAYDFSFSGLKTAVLRRVQAECGVDFTFPSHELAVRLDEPTRNNFAASFQRIAIETLVDKALLAYQQHQPQSLVIAGGVAANDELRRQLSDRIPLPLAYPDPRLCTDNAAMVASLGYFTAQRHSATDPRELDVMPSLSM